MLVLLLGLLACSPLQTLQRLGILSPASTATAAAQHRDDASPARAQDITSTVLLWGLLQMPGLKVAPKAFWSILHCQRIVFLSWKKTLTLEYVHPQDESTASCSTKTAFHFCFLKTNKEKLGGFCNLQWKQRGSGEATFITWVDILPSTPTGWAFPHRLFKTPAFHCSTSPSSAATIAHWCVLTRNHVPSDTINSEEARVISLPDLLSPADHTRVQDLSYLNLLYTKISLD